MDKLNFHRGGAEARRFAKRVGETLFSQIHYALDFVCLPIENLYFSAPPLLHGEKL